MGPSLSTQPNFFTGEMIILWSNNYLKIMFFAVTMYKKIIIFLERARLEINRHPFPFWHRRPPIRLYQGCMGGMSGDALRFMSIGSSTIFFHFVRAWEDHMTTCPLCYLISHPLACYALLLLFSWYTWPIMLLVLRTMELISASYRRLIHSEKEQHSCIFCLVILGEKVPIWGQNTWFSFNDMVKHKT
jgi:hypothetical protein